MWLKIPPSKAYSTVPWSSIYYKKQKPGKAFYSKYVLELEKKAQERETERNTNPCFHTDCGRLWSWAWTLVCVGAASPELANRKGFV